MDHVGENEPLPERLEDVEQAFPNLTKSGYQVTSPTSAEYNCVAYAAGDHQRKWDACYYWPPSSARGFRIDNLVSAFRAIGYELCRDDLREHGFEKVVLYANEFGHWTHAARQLPDGAWTSKLGDSYDIRHRSPYALNSKMYGQAMYFMKRAETGERMGDREIAPGGDANR
jgi:hypothetical protein